MTDKIEEKLYKASEYREAEDDHRRNNPTPGDYWWCDHFCPVLVVLAVTPKFITVCTKTKDVGNSKWTWDLDEVPTVLSKSDFLNKLSDRCSHVGGPHYWVVKAFAGRGEQELMDTDPAIARLSTDEMKTLVDALRFYANAESYHAVTIIADRPAGEFADDMSADHGDEYYTRAMPGKTARAALKKCGIDWTS